MSEHDENLTTIANFDFEELARKHRPPGLTDEEFEARIKEAKAKSEAHRKIIEEHHREVKRKRQWNIENVDPGFTGRRCYYCGKPIIDGMILNRDFDEYYEGDDIHLCSTDCLCGVDYTIWRRWHREQYPQTCEEIEAEIMKLQEDRKNRGEGLKNQIL